MKEFYRKHRSYLWRVGVVFVLLIGSVTYAQLQFTQEFVVETIHVFPDHISSNGWSNIETIVNQNVTELSLYQDFNSINSAYIAVDATVGPDRGTRTSDDNPTEDTPPTDVATSTAQATSTEAIENNATSTATTTEATDVATETAAATSSPATTSPVSTEEASESAPSTTTSATTEVATTTPTEPQGTTTVLRRLGERFAFTFKSFTERYLFTQATGTEPVPEETADDTPETEETEPVTPAEATATTTPTETTATTTTETTTEPTETVPSTATATSPTVSTTTATSTSDTDDGANETADRGENETPVVTTPTESVETPSESFALTLNGFGLPIFDTNLTLDGGQIRLSMAAKKQDTRLDEAAAIRVEYSFDGTIYTTAGSVEIEEEMSNSINGGYYLFALPLVDDPSILDTLSVRIVYEGDRATLEELYIESAWLELFTVRGDGLDELDPLADFDDRFSDRPLSGDRLVLPDGSFVDFDFTDDNSDETLIIKSDEVTYGGLSKATMYFNVTNTSNNQDSFEVKTYFPQGLGTVTSLEEWNQNKPSEIVIPEYRPFVYHCSAGWEATAVDQFETVFELSQDTVTSSSTEATSTTTIASSTEGSTTPVEFETSTTSTSSVSLGVWDTPLLFTQASATGSTTTVATTTPAGTAQNFSYSCRETNVIRTCDSITGEGSECRLDRVKVQDHVKTLYQGGWQDTSITTAVERTNTSRLARLGSLLGVAPDTKEVPEQFEPRIKTNDTFTILAGETKYYKMEIEFPAGSNGEFWIEAIGNREYGLLDPFWSSQWQYRLPIMIDNSGSTQSYTEQQIFFELDASLTDFWSNVQADGGDVRFVQEILEGNVLSATSSNFENPFDQDWSTRIAITIPASSTAVALVNYPVFVDMASLGSGFWSNVRSDGGDIRVTRADGYTEVPVDVVEIDTTAETGELHFLADSISATAGATFHLYVGNSGATLPAASATYGSEAVWADFEAVYHFSEDPTAISNVINDATANGRDLVVTDDALATTSGSMGTALDLTVSGTGHLTNTTWNWASGTDHVSSGLYQQGANSAEAIWQWGTSANPNFMSYMPWYNNGTANGRGYLYHGRNANAIWDRTAIVNQWTHFTTVSEATAGGRHVIFENGVEQLTNTQSVTSPYNVDDLQIGRYTTGGSYNGFIDELRFTTNDTLRTSAYTAAEYLNHTDPTTFYATSTAVLPGGAVTAGWFNTSWEKRIKLTVPEQPSEIVDFPIYVDLATLGSDFFADVASDGRDIRVTTGDSETELPYELVAIDTGAETGELHFKATLSSDEASEFYIYFDNLDAVAYAEDDTYGAQNVWTNGYLAVYHLEEDAAGTGNNNLYKDSTSNEYDGDDQNTSDGKDGQLGAGQEFGDSQVDYLSLPKEVLDGETNLTTSWWHQSSNISDMTITSGANNSQANEYWDRLDNNTLLRLYSQGGQETATLDNGATYNDGLWQHYFAIRDMDNQQKSVIRNGVRDAQSPITASPVIATTSIDNGGLIIGQDQDVVGGNFSTAENFEGNLDELRYASVVRDTTWAATVYDNQSAPETFYATSSVDSLTSTRFVELDYWIQHFDSTADEADIWVQVEEIPVGARTVIWLYYGNATVDTTSDPYTPFTYSTSTDLYYTVDDSGDATSIDVVSLIDGNEVSVDGGAAVVLDEGDRTTFSTFTATSVISVLGPITATLSDANPDNLDSVVPISFASTTQLLPSNRNTERYYIHAPFASTSASTYIANSGTANQTFSIATGTVVTATANPAGSQAVIVEASHPVLVNMRTTSPGDAYTAYPPTRRDLFGYDSNQAYLSALGANPDPEIFCSGGTTSTESGITSRGFSIDTTICAGATQSSGDALRITGHSESMAAIQQADSDGLESTTFWPQHEFGVRYGVPNDAQYIAVICSPRFGTATLQVLDAVGDPGSTGTCVPTATNPGTVFFGDINDTLQFEAGSQIVSTNGVPFYAIYEDISGDTTGDERNMLGPVQGRKFGAEEFTTVFGEQELIEDADYDQASYVWYENIDALTPTTYWFEDDGDGNEGVAISGQGAVNNGDVLRLRMSITANNATGTAGTAAFALEYGSTPTAGQCSLATDWAEVGEIGSTTARFAGYDNANVSDGIDLATSTLASTTLLGTYEERNISDVIDQDIAPGDFMEFDWVIETIDVEVNTNYCFRMVRDSGGELTTYTAYPELVTVGPPNVPELLVYFDNEHTPDLDPVLEFVATDIAGDEIDYHVQIDDNYDFSSPTVDIDSAVGSNFLYFENILVPSDKAPFNNAATIRFSSPTSVASSTTYYWRVRAADPGGSATSSDWSTPFSFTTNPSVTVSEWLQTTGDQFATNELTSVTTATGSVSVVGPAGQVVSTAIDFDDATVGNAWGEVSWNDTETSGTILYRVQYNDGGSWSNVPDLLIPGNSTGTTTSPINILGLRTDTYNEIRLVADLTGTALTIDDWRVTWGQRVETPALGDPFDNELIPTQLPIFDFVSSDPQGDPLEYEISWSTDFSFLTGSTTHNSQTAVGFASTTYSSGETVIYTTQPGEAFSNNTTYWWRARAKDPGGGDSWSPWSDPDAFTVATGTSVSTWFQTTKDQFEQGIRDGTTASTSNSVEVSSVIGEYGTIDLTNNNWTTINTSRSYTNMVVVASPEWAVTNSNGRSPRVRKDLGSDAFEIQVDNETNDLTGTTTVDYLVIEAGDWTVDNGGGGVRVVAGTVEDETNVLIQPYGTGYTPGTQVDFGTNFGTAPAAIATVSTDNDTDWIMTHIDGCTVEDEEVRIDRICPSLALSTIDSAVHGTEDIDYVVMEIVDTTVSGVDLKSFNTGVSGSSPDGTATNISFPTAFSSTPEVTLVHNNAEEGGDGGLGSKTTSGTNNASTISLQITEFGPQEGGHTNEDVSVIAFDATSGQLVRDGGVSAGDTITSEDIPFSDGAGPKFAEFSWNDDVSGAADILYQVQYRVAEDTYALIPDAVIPGNGVGTTTSPIDLTAVDISTYDTIRLVGTFTCGVTCPELDDWQVTWSEGVSMSGTLQAYDRVTSIGTGTITAAVNGVPVGSSGSVSGGTWTMNNVTAFAGDVVTVWVDGAAEEDEAVTMFVYDGAGDMTNVALYEQHLSFDSDETATITNALLSTYDNSVSGDEDIFFDVDASDNLTVCAQGTCPDANIYIASNQTYLAATTTAVTVSTHDIVNDGVLDLDANTFYISGSWINTATSSVGAATLVFNAATGTETITDPSDPLVFNDLVFGTSTSTATWTIGANLDLSGDLTVAGGTFDRGTSSINLVGNLTTNSGGTWSGTGTTTFDGSGLSTWSDGNASTSLQNIGVVVVDGISKTVAVTGDTLSYDITIGLDDTLNGGTGNTLYVGGDWTNNGTFLAGSSDVTFIIDDRTYPGVIPGSSDWYSDTDFDTRIPLSIQASEVDTTLTDFPVYVDLSMLGTDFWNNIQTDGDDIRVTTGDGQTEVPHDLVGIDTVAKTGELHFLADSVSSATDTLFYLYHDNATTSGYGVTDTYGRHAVWSGYEAVYHFESDPTTLGNIIPDASGNGKDLSISVEALATSSGQLGSALNLASSTGILTDDDWNWVAGDRIVSSGWYKMPAASSEALWAWGTGTEYNFMPWYSGTQRGYHRFGSAAGAFTFDFTPRDTVNWQHFTTDAPTSTSEALYTYINTILRDSPTQTVANPAAGPLQIGRYTTAGSLEAEIDELRFATSTRSTEWIEAEYANQGDVTTFIATGTPETYVPDVVPDAPSHTIVTGGSAFYDVTFNDPITAPAFVESSVVVNHDFVIATGTVSMPTEKTTIGGSFLNSGVFMHNNSEFVFNGSGSETITLGGTNYLNTLYDLTFNGSGDWTITDTNATSSGTVTISDGTATFPTGTFVIGETLLTTGGGAFDHSNGVVVFNSADDWNVSTRNSAFNDVRFGTNTSFPWYGGNWQERVPVVVAPGTVTEDQTDFAFYVDLGTLGNDFWSEVTTDGRDIRITTGNGFTELPREVVSINTASSTGELHFLADSVTALATTTFYIYYGNPSATEPAVTDPYGRNAVWTNYEAVYHFEQTDGSATDSSGHDRDLSTTIGSPAATSGIFGLALDTTASNVRLEDSDWTWTAGEDLISSGWYFQTAVDTGALWQFGVGSGSNNGTYLAFLPWYNSGTQGYHYFGITSGGNYTFARDNSRWHHFTTIGKATAGENNLIYEDTILRDTVTQIVSSEDPTNTGLRVGAYQTTTYMDIQIDELRFATATPNLARINAEYDNQYTPTAFYATGTPEVLVDAVSSFTLNQNDMAAEGDVSIAGARVVAPNDEFSIGGSFTIATGLYDANTATTTFDSTAGVETVSIGANSFYNLSFNGVGGNWAATGTIVATNNTSLVTGDQFTLTPGSSLEVGGTFSNTFNAASTTWTDSTLILTGGDYTVTDRLDSGDTYATLRVSGDTDIIMWNSSISTSTILDTSSIYMPDFSGTDGLLRIYGDFERATGTEHWSYATDFDGTDLTGGGERLATVELQNGSQVTFATGTTLSIQGSAAASTTISSLFGLYDLTLINATLAVRYAEIADLGFNGLYLRDVTTVSQLTDVNFIVSQGRSGITVDADTVNAQPSETFTNVSFSSTTATSIYDTDWNNQTLITIPATNIAENLTDYVVYVDMSLLGDDFWSNVESDGRDIRITTSGADELAYELVEFDTTARTGEMHFLTPALSGTNDNVFYIHYNNPSAVAYAATDQYGSHVVWSGYEAVYHFADDPTDGTPDATKHGRDLAATVGTPATTSGLLGTAIDTTAGNVRMTDTDWTWTAGEDLISSGLYFQTAVDTGALWQFGQASGSNNPTFLAFMPWYTGTTGYHRFGVTTGDTYAFTRDNSIWHHFTTIGRATAGEDNEIYEDNISRDTLTQTVAGENPTNTGLRVGAYQNTTYMDIDIDELRFATSAPSANRIATEYNNLTDAANFYATSTAATAVYNISTDGTPSTYWLFTGGAGDIYGEAFDNDDGDPGAIQWDDSDYTITVAGVVYSDDGVTPATAPVCNGSTEVVTLQVGTTTTYRAPCSASDGSYQIEGITYSGEPKLTAYIESDAPTTQTNVAVYDELTGSGTIAGSAVTVNRPNVLDDSVLVAIIGKDDDNPDFVTPLGWTLLDTLGNGTGDDIRTSIWYRVVADAGAEAASYTFTTTDNGEGYSYWIGSLLNVATATPVEATSSWVKYQDDQSPEAPQLQTTNNGALVLASWYTYFDGDVTLPFSEWDVRAENIVGGEGSALNVVSQVLETAATSSQVEVFNHTAGRESHAGQYAFRPAAQPTATGSVTAAIVSKTPIGAGTSLYADITLRGQHTDSGTAPGSGAITVPRPVTENGDVLVTIIAREDDLAVTAPAGWVKGDDLSNLVGSQMYTAIWYKVVTNVGSEPDSYDFTNTDTGAEEYAYWIGSFENVDTTNVFDVPPAWVNLQDTSTPTASSTVTVTDKAYVLAAWGVMYDNTMDMPGGAWQTLAEDINVSSRALNVVGQRFATAGATGDVSITNGSSDDVNTGQFALRPAPATIASAVNDMDFYQDRVIVRHEDVTPLSIADMAEYDSSDDSDIPFTVTLGAPDTLLVSSGAGMVVWNNKTFAPSGDITLAGVGSTYADGSLRQNASSTLSLSGSDALSIGGSLYLDTAASFTPSSDPVVFTATNSGQSIGAAGSSTITFTDLDFTGVGGVWNVQTQIISQTDIDVATGTVAGVSDITVEGGSLSGNGTVAMTGGTVQIDITNTFGGTRPWSFNNLILGDGVTGGAITTPASSATTTVGGVLTINTGHFLDAGTSVWDLSGSGNVFVESGTFLEDDSLIQYSGAAANILRTAYHDLRVDTATGTAYATAPVTSLQIFGALTVGKTGTATLDITDNDPAITVSDDVTIGTFGTLLASDSATLQIFGSYDNDGILTANGGTIEMRRATGTASIAAGGSDFANFSILGGATFTITESATATEDFILTGPYAFTLQSNESLSVGGTFTNETSDRTTWSSTTLYLYGGQTYEINSKSNNDSYNVVNINSNTQPRVWNSSFATVNTGPTSSLYSMDHAGVDGDLRIYGWYWNGTYDDHWSYETDWDGAALGIPRAANVSIEDNGAAIYGGGSLTVLGSSTASTSVSSTGGGTYSFRVGGTASSTFAYFVPRDLDDLGIQFSGTPVITDFRNNNLLVENNLASAITVWGGVIDQNPAKNFDQNIFNSDTGVIGAVNVTATGTSVSSWRFTNHGGNLDGEAFDSDSGDPGEIVWADSAALISISGVVYDDEGSTVIGLPVCDGLTENITLVVAGLTATSTTCDTVTGAYTFTNVGFGPSDAIIVYIDDGTESGATVTVDPISNINNMDIYKDRVIVRNESTDAIRIADMAVWDSSDDANIPFTAVDAGTDTLDLPTDTKLIVWSNKHFEPSGDVTLVDGTAAYAGDIELYAGAEYSAQTGETHVVGGSLITGAGADLTTTDATFEFASDQSGETIDVNDQAFHHVSFTGSGDWTITDTSFTANGDVTIVDGLVDFPAATSTFGGDMDNTGGSFDTNGGLFVFTATDVGNTITYGGSDMTGVLFSNTGSWTITDTDATTTNSFIVATGSVTLPSGVLAVGTDFIVTDTVTHNSGIVTLLGTGTHTIDLSLNDLFSLTVAGTGSYTMDDATAALLGDLTVATGSLTVATTTLSIGGSLTATGGTLNTASGTVLFNSADTGETVDIGTNEFANVVVANATGGWTFSSATTSGSFALTAANTFTLGAAETLYVGGVFTNNVGGAATTWTGSTLILASGNTYDVNTKSDNGDTYNVFDVRNGTDVALWNSDYTSPSTATGTSIYSMDHAGSDGALTIYGDYEISVGTEYWSYATDFDGVALGGSPRAVAVSFATSSMLSLISGGLEIVGNGAGTTTISSTASDQYDFVVSGGSFTASYFSFADLGAAGLDFSLTPSIASLSNGSFTLAQNSGVLITLASTTLDANASLLINNTDFFAGGFTGGVNVSLDATTTNSWNFTNHSGDLSGEDYDIDGTDACSSIRWDDSACLLTEQTHYRWRNDDGGEGGVDATWYDTDWDLRQRIRIENTDATTYTNTVVPITITYDADMQTDFDDLRFTDSTGTTTIPYWRERYTTGVTADFWVQIPTLTGNATADIYMYYDNVSATTTSSSTEVFVVADDFEDGDLDEYSGDVSLFNVGTTFVWGGANSLDTDGNESARATDGIYRNDQTVSQGEIIRYMQYIDASGVDESCTLFGVQSPGSDNENYGVCVELQGTDRLSLVRDAESTDLVGDVVVLDSTNVTYTTGWHEIEIDWQTDDTIDVSLYTSAGTLVATTSATDSNYTSGGYGFTFWGFNGGWDSYVSYPRVDTKPNIHFGVEQSDGGATWRADQNVAGTNYAVGDVARLRLAVENSGLPITDQEFQLEYAAKLTAPSCEAVAGGSFTAVPVVASCGTSPICMTSSVNVTDGDATTDHLFVETGDFTAGEVVANSSNISGTIDIGQDEFTELEYLITLTVNADQDAYCFRVTDDGTSLDSYATLPELTLEFAPTLGAVTLNDGVDIALSPGTTTTVIASSTVTDLNGFADLVTATTTFYRSGVGASCTPDNNDCYVATTTSGCSFNNCSGNSCDLVCTADFFFHADPTDAGSPNAGEEWYAFMEVGDIAANADFDTSAGVVDVLTIRAIDVTDTIGYGTLDINGATASGSNPISTIVNIGNESIDVDVNGTDLTDGAASVIDVDLQKFATSTFAYSSCTFCSLLDEIGVGIEVDLDKPTTDSPPVSDQLYWGITIPPGTNSVAHFGVNTFTATAD